MTSGVEDTKISEDTLSLEHAELLARVDLFSCLDSIHIAKLAAYIEPVGVKSGSTVCLQGDPGDCLYIVAEGAFSVYFSRNNGMGESRLSTMLAADSFGEMALLTGEPRSATVRAEGDGQILRLHRDKFLDLLKQHPSIASSIIATMSRRLRATSQAAAEIHWAMEYTTGTALRNLPPHRKQKVLEASILENISADLLRVLFGEDSESIGQDLSQLGIQENDPSALPVLKALEDTFEREFGSGYVREFTEKAVSRMADAQHWEDALSLAARFGLRSNFISVLSESVRSIPPLQRDRATHWVERLTDEEAAKDSELALLRASFHRERGNPAAASRVLRRALGTSLVNNPRSGKRLSDELTRLALAGTADPARKLRNGVAPAVRRALGLQILIVSVIAAALTVAATILVVRSPQLSFLLLLLSAVTLWVGDFLPSSTVALGLVITWTLLGLVKPAQAVAGFGSMDWLFVFAVFGIAAAVSRSGLLFRAGLLLVRRMPPTLFGQAAVLLLTGLILSPLLPNNIARSSLTAPIALAVAEAGRLRDRGPAAALLGLAAWIGAGPMAFLFLNASQLGLLAWGLLPGPSQQRFDWIHWFVAAAPLGIFVAVGMLLTLFVIFRPEPGSKRLKEGVNVQLAILGPFSRREFAMVLVVLLTLFGCILAPTLQLDFGTVALLGLVAAVLTGNFGRQGLQEIDWNFMIFYGVALSIARVAVALGLDRTAAEMIGKPLAHLGANPLLFVVGIAFLNILLRYILLATQSILLLCLVLIPVAPTIGVEPWIVVVTILATAFLWFPPSLCPAYLAAYSASEGRLYSHGQAIRVNFAYMAVTLTGLALSVFYWHLMKMM